MDEPWDTFSAFDDSDCDDADLFFDFPDDNSDSDASDLEPDRFMPVPPPIDRVHYQPHTAFTQRYAEARRRDLDEGEIGQKVIAVVKYLRDVENISLELFLDAVFWGNTACVQDPIVRHERTTFMSSNTLATVLSHMWRPPTGQAKSGQPVLHAFVTTRTQEILLGEIKAISSIMRPPDNILTKEYLTSVNFREWGTTISTEIAPTLWFLLYALAWRPRQQRENTTKDPFHVILTIITMLAYTRSSHNSVMTMLWSIYLRACGLSARAFDALHALGLTMSYRWASDAFSTLSNNAMDAMREAIRSSHWVISHDNVNIPLRVFSQRLHNKSHFLSACAATVWILPASTELPADLNTQLQQQRREGSKEPFDRWDLAAGDPVADERIRSHNIYRILRFLLDCPAFKDYAHRGAPELAPPPDVLLPCGADHVVHQHILQTVDIDESSYDGTDRLLNTEYPKQMGMSSMAEQLKTGTKRVVPWIGDQLTVERERGLIRFRHDEPNSWLRMDWVVPVFGWFHLLMAFANSLHAQYLGTSAENGLRKAFDLLGRKGLINPSTKGVFWHHLDEALSHIAEANFLACWNRISGVELEELRTLGPASLRNLAERILDEFASRKAIVELEEKSKNGIDEVLRQTIMFGSDVLPYLNLRQAMQIGSVQRMEDLLPTLLFRFAGGHNPKYTIEILELLQGLKREWPQALRDHIRTHCWLMNRSGKPDGWTAFDQGQEQNIKDIKVTWHSFGPGATLEYIRKISPAIPTLRAVKDSIASQFSSVIGRGKKHAKPKKDQDVEVLRKAYANADVHAMKPGRVINNPVDRAADFIALGSDDIFSEGNSAYSRWWSNRSFRRGTEELWPQVWVDQMDVQDG